jgi:hypothetical protein
VGHEPSVLTPAQGFPSDLTIGAWDSKPGLDVIVTNSRGLSYFSNDGSGHFTTDAYLNTVADVVAAGQLDSGPSLDLLTGEFTSTAIFTSFGDGVGGIETSDKQFFGAEGDGANFFVADVDGSGPSQDFVVTCTGTVSVVVTSGTEGPGVLDAYAAVGLYPGPADAVLARLGSEQWLVYSADNAINRSLVTYSTGPSTVTLGAALAMPIGGSPEQLDVGDFNEDGFDDIAVTLTGSGELNVLFGDGVGEGGFLAMPNAQRFLSLSIGNSASDQTQRDVKVGDLNGDGHADIAVSVQGLDAIAIFSGDGTGAFTGPHLVGTGPGSGPTRLALGRLNGDELDDVAVVGATSRKVIVLLSDPPPGG